MIHLSGLDWLVCGLFLVGILALGFSARLRDSSLLQYLAAGRSLSLPAFVATLVSTWYGGILAIGDSVKTYGVGTLLLLGVPYYVFAVIYAVFFAERVRGASQISIPERLAQRWGKEAGIVGALLVFMLAVPAAHVLMLGVLTQLATGLPLAVAVVVGTFVGTVFLYRGGLLADVRVGMLAFVGMYVGFIVLVAWGLTHYDLGQLQSGIAAYGKQSGAAVFDWRGGQGALAIFSFFVLGAWTLVDPGFHQRVASAASPELGRRGVLVCVGFWFLFDILSITTGMLALAILPAYAGGLTLFPILGDRILPPGLKAIFLCGLAGTILSAMVGYTLVSGATFGREFVARLRPSSDAEIKTYTRLGFGLACVIAIVLALSVRNVVVDLWYAYSGAVVGALLIPVAAVYVPAVRVSAPARWVAASMALAFLASFSWLVYGKRTGNNFLTVYVAGQEFGLGTLIPGLLVSAAVIGIGGMVGKRKNDDG